MTEKDKYKININPKAPSKERIKERMDFSNAYQSYTHWIYRTPWHTFQHYASKNKKITMMIILFAVIAMLIVMDYKENGKSGDTEQEKVIHSDTTALKS
jgi:hypothetical protein